MTDDAELKKWLIELKEWVYDDPEIACRLIDAHLLLLERKSTNVGTVPGQRVGENLTPFPRRLKL